MRYALKIVGIGLLLVSVSAGQDAQKPLPEFSVPGEQTAPLPRELIEPSRFHARAVGVRGELRLSFTDLSIAARGWPLTMAHFYSAEAADTGLGPGWTWNFGVSASRSRDTGTYFIHEADGSESAYVHERGATYTAVAGRLGSRVKRKNDGGLARLFTDGSREIFSSDLKLVRRIGVDGNGYTIEYGADGHPNTVLHDDGQSVSINWKDGRVKSVRDDLGRALYFSYESGFLEETKDALGRVTRFGYSENGRLTTVQFVDGSELSVEYDVNARVARLTGPGTLDTRFDHWGAIEEGRLVQTRIDAEERRSRLEIARDPISPDQVSVISTNPAGIETVRDYRDGQVDVSRNGKWVGGLLLEDSGAPAVLIQESGSVPVGGGRSKGTNSTLAYPDELGRPRLVIRTDGSSAWQRYDRAGRVVAIAGETGRVERFVYDAGNRLIEHLDPSGTRTEYRYDKADRLLEWKAGDGRWRSYAYSETGQLKQISGHDIADLTLTYDLTGQVDTVSNDTRTWTAQYDSGGRFVGFQDQDGSGMKLAYDEHGVLMGFENESGLSVQVDTENGLFLKDNLGRKRGIVLDEDDQPVQLGPGGIQQRRTTLDNGDELVSQLLPDGSGWVERRNPSGDLISAETRGHDPFFIETNARGEPARLGDPLRPSTMKFDDGGLLTETTDELGVTSHFEHDEKGRLVSASSPYAAFELEYGDEDGEIPRVARTNDGVTLRQEVDEMGRPTKFTYENESGVTFAETMEYDDRDRLVRMKTERGVTEFRYPDEHTREMRIKTSSGTEVWRERYDPEARVVTLERPDGTTSTTKLDEAGRPVSIETPTRRISYELDPEGRVLSMTTDGHKQELASDSFGWRVVDTENVEDREDGVVRIETMRDPRGNRWQVGYTYDDYAVWSKDPLGGVSRVERTAGGQIKSVTDPEGRVHYAAYDDLGRPTESGVVGGWAVAFGWERNAPAGWSYSGGTRLRVEPAGGRSSARSIVNDEVDAEYAFHDSGRLASATNETGSIEIEYRDGGEPASVNDVFDRRVVRETDELGRITALVLPDGDRITYAYPDGNTIRRKGPDGAVTTTKYRPGSASYSVSLPEGASARLDLAANDDYRRLTVEGAGGETEGSLEVDRDEARAVTGVSVNGDTKRIDYDALGRMVSVDQDGEPPRTWTYDGSGNIVETGDAPERVYNEAFQLIRIGEESLEYDADGRLIRKGETNYEYNATGQLVRISGPSGTVEYRYDAFSRLVERRTDDSVERYLWHDGRVLAVYDGDGKRIALFERNLALPGAVRFHGPEGSRTLLPDQVGTPRFSVRDGGVRTLPGYGPWGRARGEGPAHRRWLGYTGKLQDPDFGIVHMGARVYLPALSRFNAPDPLGIENPVNPYIYASLQPFSFLDADGHTTYRLSFGPYNFGVENLPSGRGLPTGSGTSTPWNRKLFADVLKDLRKIAANDSRPNVRDVASRTLQVLRSKGTRLEMGPHVKGYGSHKNGRLAVNPVGSTTRDPRFRGAGPDITLMEASPRSVGGVLAHEGTHSIQDAYEKRTGRIIGRMWKEFEATMSGDLIERAVGGYRDGVSERQAFREALDYAIRTEYSQYLPSSHPEHLPNNVRGTGLKPWTGLTQLDHHYVRQLARKYYPNLPAENALEEFIGAHRRMQNAPTPRSMLRNVGGDEALAAQERIVREAEAARDAYRRGRGQTRTPGGTTPAPPRSPGAGRTAAGPSIEAPSKTGTRPSSGRPYRPGIVDPPGGTTPNPPRVNPPAGSSSGPTIEPPRARARAPSPPQPNSPSTGRVSTPDLPNAGSTQRLPAADLPDAGATRGGSRPSGASAEGGARQTARRPSTQRLDQVPHTVDSPNPGPRPPATGDPPRRNPRTRVNLEAPRPDTGRAPDTPSVRSSPPPWDPEVPRLTPPDRSRPALDAPRPSARGGRYAIPDLGQGAGTQGGRVRTPPGSVPEGARGRAVRRPIGAARPSRFSGWGTVARESGLNAVDLAAAGWDTYQYLEGNMSTGEYVKRMGITYASMAAPYPINAAIAAHQVGSLIGGLLAEELIREYRKGNPLAEAMVNWLRKNGWINANDPTFVAVPERHPPDLGTKAMLVSRGKPQWIPLMVWSDSDRNTRLTLEDGNGETVAELGTTDLTAGATHTFLPPESLSGYAPGLYRIRATGADEERRTVLALRIVADEEETSEELPETDDGPQELTITTDVVETRLEPTNLPWSRFDRRDVLIEGEVPAGAELHGDWKWIEDREAPGGRTHEAKPGTRPVHYALLEEGVEVVGGENLVQYLWLDPDNAPDQVVLQVYDERLSGAHRASFGAEVLPVPDRHGFGLVQSGPLPATGKWIRLRIPVEEVGMDGRRIAGVGFLAGEGRAVFGPTRLSGAEDSSPRMVPAASRDVSGAPQSNLSIRLDLPSPGELELSLELTDGGRVSLYSDKAVPGKRHFWWQGKAKMLRGARAVGTFTTESGETVEVDAPVSGNPSLVARILYPPRGAIVRQTVPVFGQAGGADLRDYVVEYRRFGAEEASWQELARSREASVMNDADVQRRIDDIMAKELRGTIHGNLASLKTGSVLHDFEFEEGDEVMSSGWIELRLRSYDEEGHYAESRTTVRIGEVATGQERSVLTSPDGKATLSLPPLVLPAGLGTFSIDRVGQKLPPGAPSASSRVYTIAPSGLRLRAPVEIGIESESGGSIVMLDPSGEARALPSGHTGSMVEAQVEDPPKDARFYVASVQPEQVEEPKRNRSAPWFREAPEPGLIAAKADPKHGAVFEFDAAKIEAPSALVLSLTVKDPAQLALVLRFDGDARVVPIGDEISGIRDALTARPLKLSGDNEPTGVLLPLKAYLPESAQRLEAVELVRITSAAWRTFVPETPLPDQAQLHTVALGTVPESAGAWISPSAWSVGREKNPAGEIRPDAEGWHWVSLEGSDTEWPILIDRTPPELSEPRPADQAETSELVISVKAADESVGINPRSLNLTVNGVQVPQGTANFDWQNERITVPLGKVSGLSLPNGSEVSAKVKVSDLLGLPSEALSWRWRYKAEALAYGSLRQLTVDGGRDPSWLPDESGFVFVAERDGQGDIGRFDLANSEVTWLTEEGSDETAPAISEDGKLVYLSDGVLTLNVEDETTSLGEGFVDPTWHKGRIVAGAGNRLVAVAKNGETETLGEAATGAAVRQPQSFGDAILFTQEIYHRTIWICYPDTAKLRPLSRNPDSPQTRDVDPAPASAGTYFYVRQDGGGGVWRGHLDACRESMVLAPEDSFDRRPAISEDGTQMLFDSDRTGRREVWLMTLERGLDFFLDQDKVRGTAGSKISGEFSVPVAPSEWRLVGDDGEAIEADLSDSLEDKSFTISIGSEIPEGNWHLELESESGSVLRQPLTVDRSQPRLTMVRERDGAKLSGIEEIRPGDRFRIKINDETPATLTDIETGEPLSPDASLPATEPGTKDLRIRITDGVGNSVERVLDLSVGPRTEAPLMSAAGDGKRRSPGFGNGMLILASVGVLGFALLAGFILWRRKRT